MRNSRAELEADKIYHVYNRANNRDKIFYSDLNFEFFLKKYQEYVSPVAETFCYCLMPNHFHFLVRIRPENIIQEYFTKLRQEKRLYGFQNSETSILLSNQFSKFLNSYSKAFNKFYDRRGSLFMKNFKRIAVEEKTYLLNLVRYIHFNPIEAGLSDQLRDWKYSSYGSIVSESPVFINSPEVLTWFDGLNNFEAFHKNNSDEFHLRI